MVRTYIHFYKTYADLFCQYWYRKYFKHIIWYKEIKKKHALMGYATIFAIYEKEKVALLKLIAK